MISVIYVHGGRVRPDGRRQITIIFESPRRLQSIEVFDAGGAPLPVEQPQDCPERWVVLTPPVLESQLPLQAQGVDCTGTPTSRDEVGPIYAFPEDPLDPRAGDRPCSPTSCPEVPPAACEDALESVAEAVRNMRPGCERCAALDAEVQRWQNEFDFLFAAWAVATAIAILLSSVLPWPANLIVGAIAGAVAAVLLGLLIHAGVMHDRALAAAERCREDLDDLRSRVQQAIEDANARCCGCFGAGLMPPC